MGMALGRGRTVGKRYFTAEEDADWVAGEVWVVEWRRDEKLSRLDRNAGGESDLRE